MDNFKRVFRHTLDMVLTQYRSARIELDGRGMTLRNSAPPIKGRVALVRRSLTPNSLFGLGISTLIHDHFAGAAATTL